MIKNDSNPLIGVKSIFWPPKSMTSAHCAWSCILYIANYRHGPKTRWCQICKTHQFMQFLHRLSCWSPLMCIFMSGNRYDNANFFVYTCHSPDSLVVFKWASAVLDRFWFSLGILWCNLCRSLDPWAEMIMRLFPNWNWCIGDVFYNVALKLIISRVIHLKIQQSLLTSVNSKGHKSTKTSSSSNNKWLFSWMNFTANSVWCKPHEKWRQLITPQDLHVVCLY